MTAKTSREATLLSIRPAVIICLFLLLVTLAVYWRVGQFDFVNFDDQNFSDNHFVQSGLTPDGFRWSFSFNDKEKTYWHPLTWLSHMLDVEIYGMNPGGHHLTNLLLHIASSLLLFLVFHRMTGALWRPAFVAMLFALNPLNVESVAWISERKNVLSTFFWMLTLWAYAYYTRKPSSGRYAAVMVAFTLGLLAKPMLVTLPFVLILLDYWPLARITLHPPELLRRLNAAFRLILEKIPLLVLSLLSVYLSAASLKGAGNIISFESVSLFLRIENALVSYLKYIGKFIWPANLAVYYHYPDRIPWWQVLGALAVLAGISICVIRALRKHPYLGVGWLWYLGTLIPVIGLIQAGLWPAMADRWVYVPLIGLFIMLAWGIPQLVSRWQHKRIILLIGAGVLLIILTITTHNQIGHWRNSVALFEHALKSVGSSDVAHNNLGHAFYKQNKLNKAIKHYFIALDLNPKSMLVYNNLGNAFAKQGKPAEAIKYYSEALQINPDFDVARLNLGNTLLEQGKNKQAAACFYEALSMNPDFAEYHNSLGLALLRMGKLEEAIYHFRTAFKLKPYYADARRNLKLALIILDKLNRSLDIIEAALDFTPEDSDLDYRMEELLKRKFNLEQALGEFQRALSKQPGFKKLDVNNITAVSELKKKYERKLPLFQKIREYRPENAGACYHMACIYARKGQINESIKWFNQAIQKGFDRWDLIKVDSDLESIRDSEGYRLLSERS
jgi:tetratricopeptide (TPR) repeat protein